MDKRKENLLTAIHYMEQAIDTAVEELAKQANGDNHLVLSAPDISNLFDCRRWLLDRLEELEDEDIGIGLRRNMQSVINGNHDEIRRYFSDHDARIIEEYAEREAEKADYFAMKNDMEKQDD